MNEQEIDRIFVRFIAIILLISIMNVLSLIYWQKSLSTPKRFTITATN